VTVGAVVAVVAISLLLAGGGNAGATGSAAAAELQEDNDTDDDRPLHENPDSASGDGDSGVLADRLAGELAGALEGSAVRISEGEYEQGSELLGPEYQERLDQYVEVAGETGGAGARTGGSGNQTPEDFSEELRLISDRQANLSRTLSRYNDTLAEYRAPRDRGNAKDVRTVARRLVTLTTRLEELDRELQSEYERLAAFGVNVTQEHESLNATISDTTHTTERITEEAFVRTTLTVSGESEAISYRDLLRVEGQLVDANGTPISGARIVIPDPAGPSTTRTDDDGRFSLTYRPVGRSIENETVPVAYRPAPTSPYQAAEQPVAVDISAVDGTLTIDAVSESVAFGDRLEATAQVRVDGKPVSGLPLRLIAAGVRSRTRTTEEGSATFAPNVTAALPPGTRTLRVSMTGDDRAVALTDATATVTIASTPTTLRAEATPTPGGTAGEFVVDGRLTVDGQAVPNQSVDLVIGGQLVETARTDDSGAFTATIDSTTAQGTVTVEAVYDEPTTNLEATTAETTIDLGASRASGFGIGSSWLVAGGILIALAGLAVAFWRGLRPLQAGDTPDEETDQSAEPDEPAPQNPDSDVLTAAADRVETAPEDATALAYGTTRQALASRVDATDRATHWEFYQTCEADGLTAKQVEALETVTERYEDAVFSPAGVDADGAREALAAAEQLAVEE
jgi:hypothetical protein